MYMYTLQLDDLNEYYVLLNYNLTVSVTDRMWRLFIICNAIDDWMMIEYLSNKVIYKYAL